MEEFSERQIDIEGASIFVRCTGDGPPLLLLHGFPETHLMWRDVAPRLAQRFTVVCADLRGYGRSSCPPSAVDHSPYSKRAMANDMIRVMEQLGFARFAVAGHDRGGRVAYRLALDHPENICKVAVLDIGPTAVTWDLADHRFALAFWPWSLLAQSEPLPERLIGGAPDAVVDNALAQWGSGPTAFPAAVKLAYVNALRDESHIHAICEEYRAAATIDREHDAADHAAGNRISCPLLVLWSASGGLASWYDAAGGPLALWRGVASDVRGGPVEGGHFFPEEEPEATAAALLAFFSDTRSIE
ncbi:MAG: alpha/beta hydrolase [bacterium]